MRRILFYLLLATSLFFTGIQPVSAKIDLTFSSPPTEISANQSFSLDVTLSGASETTPYYIRGIFYKENTTQYFGYTLNNAGVWHSSAVDHQQFFQITGNQTIPIQFKPDLDSTYFQGSGNYLFKIGRYTAGGSVTWSDQITTVSVIDTSPSPSPTPIPTSIPSPPPTPSPTTPSSPSPTPPNYPTQLMLSEIMPCPEDGSEWVEIKNNNDVPVTLESWLIRDETVSNKFPFSVTIPAQGLTAVEVSPAILNNTNDSVKLVNPAGTVVHQMSYTNCESDQSFIWHDNAWQKTLSPTKSNVNQLTILTSPTPTPMPSPKSSPTASFSPSSSLRPTTTPISTLHTTSPTQPLQLTNADFEQYQDSSLSAQVLGLKTINHSPDDLDANSDSLTAESDISPTPSLTAAWLALFGGSTTYLSVGGYWLWQWYNQIS